MKSITADPPLERPYAHVIVILEPLVNAGLLAKFKGASGTVSMIAPVPYTEVNDVP